MSTFLGSSHHRRFHTGKDFPPVLLSQAKRRIKPVQPVAGVCSSSSVSTRRPVQLNHTVGIVLEWSVQVFSALTSHRHNHRQQVQLSADCTLLAQSGFCFSTLAPAVCLHCASTCDQKLKEVEFRRSSVEDVCQLYQVCSQYETQLEAENVLVWSVSSQFVSL